MWPACDSGHPDAGDLHRATLQATHAPARSCRWHRAGRPSWLLLGGHSRRSCAAAWLDRRPDGKERALCACLVETCLTMGEGFSQVLLHHVSADAEPLGDVFRLKMLKLAKAKDFGTPRGQFGDSFSKDLQALVTGDVRFAVGRAVGNVREFAAFNMAFAHFTLAQPVQREVASHAIEKGERVLNDGALIEHRHLHAGLLHDICGGLGRAKAPLNEAAQRLVVMLEGPQQRRRALRGWRVVLVLRSARHFSRLSPTDKNKYHSRWPWAQGRHMWCWVQSQWCCCAA